MLIQVDTSTMDDHKLMYFKNNIPVEEMNHHDDRKCSISLLKKNKSNKKKDDVEEGIITEKDEVIWRLQTACWLCGVFIILEVVGGYISGSLAVLSDAAHMFSDLASFAVAIMVAHWSNLPPNEQNTYGYKRTEAVSALFSMLSLAIVSLLLLVQAFIRLYKHMASSSDSSESVDGKTMSIIAALGVFMNITLALILKENHVHLPGHSHSHDHSHEHSHDHSHHQDETHHHKDSSHLNGNDHHPINHNDDASKNSIIYEQLSFLHSSHNHDHHETMTSSCCSSNPKHHDNHHHNHKTMEVSSCYGSIDSHPLITMDDENQPSSSTHIHVDEVNHHDHHHHNQKKNVNLHAVYMHVIGDLIQSVAVFIAGVIIYFKPEWYIIDTICTIVFCVLVGYSTYGIIRSSVSVLLNEVPPNLDWTKVYDAISSIPGINNVHDLHIWSIAHDEPILSVHASADNVEQAMEDLSKVLKHKFGIHHSTIQLQSVVVPSCITCQ